jgi:hypothetical protein
MQPVDEALLTKEAQTFTRYLIGKEADEQTIQLYISAHKKLDIGITEKEARRIKFLLGTPSFIGMADSALALSNSESGIRKKIYILFSILESRPEFAKYFLPKEQKMPVLSIIGSGVRASWNALWGTILLIWI